MSRKPFKKEEKLAAIELWRASVPLAKIRSQLGMSKATLKRVLAFAKANPANPIKPRMPGSGNQYLRNLVESMPRRLQEVIACEGGLTKY